MSRLRLDLQYDGSAFHGWQNQPNAPTVQAAIEKALFLLNSHHPVDVVGCGRTDTGVHAKHYVAHCDFSFADLDDLKFKLNGMLPSGIAILDIVEAKADFHARFDANQRTYRYFISKKKNPFQEAYAYYFRKELDLEKMNVVAQQLVGRKDFESFAKHHSDVNNFICEVTEAFWVETEEQYVFQISANRFLRNMVRSIVGTLLEFGLGNLEEDQMAAILAAKDRAAAGTSVPGKGLFLWQVSYDSQVS
jgi:tRNA pseudouridine38-40 synthase